MRDESGTITGIRPTEPEWDATERDWMLALAEYEATLCPGCGLPDDICKSGEMGLDHTARVCWGSAHRRIAEQQWRESHPDSKFADCLLTSVWPKQ